MSAMPRITATMMNTGSRNGNTNSNTGSPAISSKALIEDPPPLFTLYVAHDGSSPILVQSCSVPDKLGERSQDEKMIPVLEVSSWSRGYTTIQKNATLIPPTDMECTRSDPSRPSKDQQHKDAAMSEAAILRYEEGQPESKRVRKSAANHQKRVKNLCQQHERGEKKMAQFLIAMGQCIRLAR
ncbi:hypothetical protein MAR_004607 [Mya arenaria]|uniref:Uncharacterized protein n=1 Tax=Mya arenaria TaxID=6604 RepID=A0ABY7F075_MYAAR|nr:hypothetical protein MAR_004607 [Mya arenaria]